LKRRDTVERRDTVKKIFFILSSALIFSLGTGFFTNQGTALMVRKSIEELTYEADSILIGEVKSMESRWNEDRTLIYTYVTISPRDYVKKLSNMGESEEITVKIRGGEVDGIGLRVSDTPEFREGEEVFLFLKKERLTIFRVAGLFQGKYTVEDGRAKNKVLGREIPLDILVSQINDIRKEARVNQ
jgi:hypothetical protein